METWDYVDFVEDIDSMTPRELFLHLTEKLHFPPEDIAELESKVQF